MIAQALNEKYRALSAKQEAERPFKFGPSSLGDCMRKQAFLLSGMQGDPISVEQARVFELGHQRGAHLEQLAREIWPDAISQVAVSIPLGKFTLRGTCDLWIPSLLTVVDFKTAGAFGAGLLATEGVSEDYQLQIHAYRDGLASSYLYGSMMPEEAVDPSGIRGVIVYEVKDSDARRGVKAGSLIEMEVPWTEALEKRYQDRLLTIEGLMIRHDQGNLDPFQIPPLPLEKGKKSWKCRVDEKTGKPLYCRVGPIRGRCYED
jgi:hypothetical protein